MELFDNFEFTWRWLHIVAGVAWIGLLYYFNFVQVPAFAAYGEEGRARNVSINVLARRALWWFRWASVVTVVTGLLIVGFTEAYTKGDFWKSVAGMSILVGIILALVMFLNVWGVIWRNQQTVLANAAGVLSDQAPNPAAATAGRRAFMASRQNTIFSVAMIWFMTATSHFAVLFDTPGGGARAVWIIISLIVIGVLEANALGLMPWKFEPNKGLNVIYDGPGVRNPLIAAFVLWAFFWIFMEIVF